MKKIMAFLLALVLITGQAWAFTITKTVEERFNDSQTPGASYRRVTGTLGLDSSHPAAGESILPSALGMASFTRFHAGPVGPGAWTAQTISDSSRNIRNFGFDYTSNRLYVITTVAGSSIDISGPITYDLSYLTSVPFEAVGPIS